MESHDRIAAIARLGFTERQARFLVLVMQHSGVCLLRQYTAFAGIVHGQKTRKFFAKLVSRKLATAYACRHNRGRVYHVHHKALYRAIGETDSRHRRPLSPERIIQGLATVDALLATPTTEYLTTADERTRRLQIEQHLFKDKHPVGVDPDGRVVLLYVATEACSHRFLAFLQRQQSLLRSLPTWTLRICRRCSRGNTSSGCAPTSSNAAPLRRPTHVRDLLTSIWPDVPTVASGSSCSIGAG
jgi:hypothetical protein